MPAPQQPVPTQPIVAFQYEGPNGPGQLDNAQAMQMLAAAGYQPQSVSPDGLTVTLVDQQGPYQVAIADALAEHGNKVTGVAPLNFDSENVQHDWRAAVEFLPDEASKKAYIEARMKRNGVENPMVIGQGSDYFVFNPNNGQYIAVTNVPGMDMSDAWTALSQGGRMLGSAVGGALGAAGGTAALPVGGTIVGGAAGAAGGSAAFDTLARGGMALADEDFRTIAGQNMGKMAADVAGNAAWEGLGGAGVGILGKAAKAFSPISTTAKTAGLVSEGAGSLANMTGKALTSPLGRQLGQIGVPAADTIGAAGWLMQAPDILSRGAAKGLGYLGKSETMRRISPGMAAGLRNTSRGLLAPRPRATDSVRVAEEVAARFGGTAPGTQATARDVLGNLAEGVGTKVNQSLGHAGREVERQAALEAYQKAIASGASYEQARRSGIKAAVGAAEKGFDSAQRWGRAGEVIGEGVEGLRTMGQGLEKTAEGIVAGAGYGLRGAGATAQGFGRGARIAGTVGQPLEARAWTSLAGQNYGRPLSRESDMEWGEELDRRLNPSWRRKGAPRMSEEILASYR